MRFPSKLSFLRTLAIVPLIALAVLLMPQPVSAEAGSGGGGGSNGCSQYNYSTCFGAVWRYYKTTSNSYPIKNVGAGYTYATNCGSAGGFFAYVLVHKNYPNDPGSVRSWKIGPVDGEWGNRSEFFGGWTRYRLPSNPSDGIPTNPGDGDYSWYSVEKAFAQTKSLGQNSGYNWNQYSDLGWFCYQGLNYTLTPTINGSPSSGEGGSAVNLTPNVANEGPTQSSNVAWEVNTFNLNPTEAIPAGGTSAQTAAQFYGHNPSLVASGTQMFARGNIPLTVATQTLGDLPIGSRVCYTLSVRPYSATTGNNARHSTPFCVTISKKPKVQILGSDLVVGKSATSTIVTATTRKTVSGTALTYGSWGEYGVIASGMITGFGSGGGYSGGNTSAAYCDASYLTFTNAGSSTCAATGSTKGGYGLAKQLPDIAGRFIYNIPITGTSLDLAAVSTGIYGVDPRTSPTINVAGGTIAKGKAVIISAGTATVNITSNIEYTNEALNRAADIPQVVIIANNINIDESVTRVDAWLIATGPAGNINTCSRITNPAAQLNATLCKNTLTVNGPVVARHLYLYRTGGSENGAGSGIPAEVFNLRPDAYLWATNYMASTGRLQTVSTKELPPRF
jgi:hypothetical protein